VAPNNRSPWIFAALAFLGCAVTAPSPNVAPPCPTAAPTTCKDSELSSTPTLIGWMPESRQALAELAERGAVAVRYTRDGCSAVLEVLPECSASSANYQFSPYWSLSSKFASNPEEGRAQLPLFGPPERAEGSSLRAIVHPVGSLQLPASKAITTARLHGADCSRATHVVRQMFVGAFELTTQGGQGRPRLLEQEGDQRACQRVETTGTLSPGCRVPLRLELEPIAV
jgi:hypothetical protein